MAIGLDPIALAALQRDPRTPVEGRLNGTAYTARVAIPDYGARIERHYGRRLSALKVDGGATANGFLMQFQADVLGIPVEVPVIHETTALGAAYLAALGVGDMDNLEEISEKWKLGRRYEPTITEEHRLQLMHQWKRCVERTRAWIEA